MKLRLTIITRISIAKHQPRRAMVFVKSVEIRQERKLSRRGRR